MEKMLKVSQVAKILNRSTAFTRARVASGEIKGFKVGKHWNVYESDVEAYLAAQKEEAQKRTKPEK